MTVTSTTNRESYTGNGIATSFSFPHYFLQDSDLVVWTLDSAVGSAPVLAVLNSDYTITGAGVAAGGAVVFGTAPASTKTIVILDQPTMDQLTHYVPGDPFPAASHEMALDRLTLLLIAQSEKNGRSPRLPINYPAQTDIPPPVEGGILAWAGGKWAWLAAATASLAANLLNAVDAALGPALISFNKALAYTAGTVGSFLNDLGTAAAGKGASLVGYLAPFTGAVGRTLYQKNQEWVSVFDFGAVGDGVTDDTGAIQAAINSGVSRIHLPAGNYIITSPLYINSDGITLYGDGVPATTITKTNTTVGTGSNVMRNSAITDSYAIDAGIIIKHSDNNYRYLTNITDMAIITAAGGNIGIYAPRISHSRFRNLRIYGWKTGFLTNDAWFNTLHLVVAWSPGVTGWNGFYWQDDGSGQVTGTSNVFMNCWAREGTGYGWNMKNLDYSNLIGCGADNITGQSYLFNTCRVVLLGCGTEGCTQATNGYTIAVLSGSAEFVSFHAASIGGASGGAYFKADGSSIVLDNCQFDAFVAANGAYNMAIQNGATVVQRNTILPSGGNTFVSYSSLSKLVNGATGVVTDSTGSSVGQIALTSWSPTALGLGGSGIIYTAKYQKVGSSWNFSIVVNGTGLTATAGSTKLSLPFIPTQNCAVSVTTASLAYAGAGYASTDGNLYLPTLSSTAQILISGNVI